MFCTTPPKAFFGGVFGSMESSTIVFFNFKPYLPDFETKESRNLFNIDHFGGLL
jgi:hypothetical protein